MSARFSVGRLTAVIRKEFVQMRRDRLTFAMMVGIPVLQLVLFGYAINTDPKHLPTAVVAGENGPFIRAIMSAIEVSGYFNLVNHVTTESDAQHMLKRGEAQFIFTFPVDFERKLLRGDRPALLLEADATDPMSVVNAMATISVLAPTVLDRDFRDGLNYLRGAQPPFDLVIHRRFNPEQNTHYNIVPGLLGVILTMTMVFITALAITRESERGTMENLLATPVRPFEVMLGKIIPYIFVGFIQASLILLGARLLFQVPMIGSIPLLMGVSLVFIAANLAVGVTFSTIARNQLQAVQLSIFFFLPSILLSGFMFPFRGMPMWAQYVGNILPLTHYLPIIRGILLKGNGWRDIYHETIPLALFLLMVMSIGVKRYRQTLD